MKLRLVSFVIVICFISAANSLIDFEDILFGDDEEESPTTTTTTTQPPTGRCELKIRGKCIDVTGGNNATGTPLDIYTCNQTPAQQWYVPGDGTIRAFGKCMDLKEGKTTFGTVIWLYDCNETPAQQWVFSPTGQLKSVKSGLCLDVKGTVKDGQQLIIATCQTFNAKDQAVTSTCESIFPKTPQPTGVCSIKVSDKCIDVAGGSSETGTRFDIYACNGSPAQRLTVKSDGTIRAFGKCMDVYGSYTDNGTPIWLYDCNDTPAQKWVFLSNGQLMNPMSKKCLDVQDGLIQDWQALIIYDCGDSNSANQVFESSCQPPDSPINPQPEGNCEITVAGKCVDVRGSSTADETPIDIYSCNGSPAQDWIMEGDGTIRAFDKCMDVSFSGTESGTRVQLYECNETPAQQWVISAGGQIMNPHSEKCLDIENGEIQDLQRLIISDCSDSTSQVFDSVCQPFEAITAKNPQPTGACTILAAEVGKCVHVTDDDDTSGTLIDILDCNEFAAQDWYMPGNNTIKSLDKCMDVRYSGTVSGTFVQLFDCNGSSAQEWISLSSGQWMNPHSNMCLDVLNQRVENGQPLIINECNDGDIGTQFFDSICVAAPP